ncbi:MAG: membrane protein insertion efficiency factor YidD [Candidatus Omnitrophica bacterium]|nr:membrane protein insertion efficiency factor YidD [Candidatus Omnitrophota bacterium]
MQTPQHSLAATLAIRVIQIYRNYISYNKLQSCRFLPSCSSYACQALERYGFWRGGMKIVGRLLRCHPLGPWGVDPLT